MSVATDTGSLFGGLSSKGLTTGIGDLGGAATDLFAFEGTQISAENDRLSATAYREAASLATENLGIEEKSVAIKQTQADRSIYQNESSQKATAAANGFQEAGSAASILADSANQGRLQKTLIDEQGTITENATRAQISSLNAQAQEADNAASGSGIAGIGDLIGGAFKAVSSIASLALL